MATFAEASEHLHLRLGPPTTRGKGCLGQLQALDMCPQPQHQRRLASAEGAPDPGQPGQILQPEMEKQI